MALQPVKIETQAVVTGGSLKKPWVVHTEIIGDQPFFAFSRKSSGLCRFMGLNVGPQNKNPLKNHRFFEVLKSTRNAALRGEMMASASRGISISIIPESVQTSLSSH